MGKTNYNALLNDKVMAEYEDFITELKGKSAEEIIQRAYEKVTKEVMMLLCDDLKLEQKEARALYLEKHPLEQMYQTWLKNDTPYSDLYRDSMVETARNALNERSIKKMESR